MWARPPVVEVVTSIALLSDSTTTRGEYLALATKRITGEWHFHGGKKKSGESMPDATRRETKEEHGVGRAILSGPLGPLTPRLYAAASTLVTAASLVRCSSRCWWQPPLLSLRL